METTQRLHVYDAHEADFEQRVVARSHALPVLVDFWAGWCAPCRALGPVLERAVASRAGAVELAKVDVDSNPGLSRRFQVQGIPAVKAFRDGRVVSEFTGALPPPQIESFLDALVPSEADRLAAQGSEAGDEARLRRALELDPRHADAAVALARLLLRRGEPAEALAVAEPLAPTDFRLAGLAARAELTIAGDPPSDAFAAWDEGDHEQALELLQEAVASSGEAGRRERLRAVMVGLFTELGADHPLARAHRRRLAAALS